MKFFIPSIEEQTAIAEVLQTADKEIELLKAKTEQLKEQKKGLMQQLLTGRMRVNLITINK
jgi:type I restriction enzyme S subunit